METQFYALLLAKLGLSDDPDFANQHDNSRWPAAKARLTQMFKARSRDEWCALLEGTDACFAPVLSTTEAVLHPHNLARGTFVEAFGQVQPAPAPRYSDSETRAPTLATKGADGDALLSEAGYAQDDIARLRQNGVLG